MSVIVERPRRGTIPFGKRDLPEINTKQLDHPITRVLDPRGGSVMLRHMEREAYELASSFIKVTVNPSLANLERYVLFHLKTLFQQPLIQNLRWCTELPPSVQREINTVYANKPTYQPVAGMHLMSFSDRWV